MSIEVSCNTDPSNLSAIATGLSRHAEDIGIEPRNAQPLFAMSHDQQGRLIGGLCATTVWGWLQIKELWVAESARGSDTGSRLMNAAEREALSRGCHHALVDTFDFQARPFYEKLGYEVFGELDDFPLGHRRYFMKKRLLPSAGLQYDTSTTKRVPS